MVRGTPTPFHTPTLILLTFPKRNHQTHQLCFYLNAKLTASLVPTLDRDWNAVGRSRIMPIGKLKALVDKTTVDGGTLGDKDLRSALNDAMASRRKSRGLSQKGGETEVSDDTVKLYMAEAKRFGRVTTSATDKTQSRWTSERSIRSMLAFVGTAAATSYIVIDSGGYLTTGACEWPQCERLSTVRLATHHVVV